MANILARLLQWVTGSGAHGSNKRHISRRRDALRYKTYPSPAAVKRDMHTEGTSIESCLSLAKSCMNPKCPPIDYDTALYYAEEAAERGSREGIELVIHLLEGNYPEGDHTELLAFWRRTRAKMDEEAQALAAHPTH
jgi:hypothetical protein